MFKTHCSYVALLLFAMMVRGAETNSPVQSLGQGRFVVGLVNLDASNRTATFPASVCLREETVEYAIVHKTGKTHESIFRTDARPQDIQLALLLLGAKPVMTNSFGADGKAAPLGSPVTVFASWSHLGVHPQYPVEDLIIDRDTTNSLAHGGWIYNGSNFSEGAFTAERDGSILSLHIDADALINNPRPGRTNDDLHIPHAAKLPPIGTPVEITIRLNQR
jgi:hypothetical protein